MKKRSVESHASEILDALESNEDLRSMTIYLLRMADNYRVLESNNTVGEAAGLVYIAGILTDHPVTLSIIAEKARISPETARKYKTRLVSQLKSKDEWPGLPSGRT